ncbi:hypothetical protein LB543_27640 [Mesorhizobium sp. ESP7-2]|uniref:hypothetical protein n=1 Tax=Mesorhizobium sp. ESP7-2 TaxID=2876622 RepID=UPI001CCC1497|nr:hypothetical protein [Mesorhizobium sp. ESP7-2]MBZ9710476.1 hypothetical protein [Mesorhizobium sp. ESP7-2]
MDRQAIMIAEGLRPHEVKALRILAGTAGDFDPVGSLPGLAQPMIDHLLAMGLAEQGIANEYKGTVGYRLSPLGSAVFSSLKDRKRQKPKLRMIASAIKSVDLRIAKPPRK